jgi:hypothetical protein
MVNLMPGRRGEALEEEASTGRVLIGNTYKNAVSSQKMRASQKKEVPCVLLVILGKGGQFGG